MHIGLVLKILSDQLNSDYIVYDDIQFIKTSHG